MIPVYAVGNQRPAAVVITKINSELLPAARNLLQLLIAAGIEWTANGMTEQLGAAEAAGETKLEGMDTNDLRAVNQVFNGFHCRCKTAGRSDAVLPSTTIGIEP